MLLVAPAHGLRMTGQWAIIVKHTSGTGIEGRIEDKDPHDWPQITCSTRVTSGT
jgi:hypothetical protein